MKRLPVVAFLAVTLLAPPLAAEAQPAGKVYRIGFLWDSPAVFPDAIEAFRQGLDRLPTLAAELIRLQVDVLVVGGTVAAQRSRIHPAPAEGNRGDRPGPDRSLVLIGQRGQGKSHLMAALHHALIDAAATRTLLQVGVNRELPK